MEKRERIHRLIDELPESELSEIERYLAQRRDNADPVLAALANAPVDDEPLTPEEEAALEEGLEALRRGAVVSDAELWRRLGQEPAD